MNTQNKTTYPVAIIVTLKHDKGRVKIKTWANSLEAAKSQVLAAENAPESSVISVKVAPVNISDIKYLTAENAPYFFDRKTMRFFGQTMRDFSVTRYGDDKFFISAPRPFGNTERIFNPFTRELEFAKTI